MRIFFLCTMMLLACDVVCAAEDGTVSHSASDYEWFDGSSAVTVALSGKVSPVVTVAFEMFCDDIKQVTGMLPERCGAERAAVRVVQLDRDRKSVRALKNAGVPVDSLRAKKEAFFITVMGKGAARHLAVVGSDGRGTAYGILELSRLAGVSPWVWWGDVTPIRRKSLTVPSGYHTFQSPSVEYRGIFLNDEDWSLQPWSWKTFEPSSVKGRIGAKTYKEIFKLLMRLRANAIWPGMHGITTPFYLVPGAKEVADSCGIVIGTSHCEPMMRSNVGEWKRSVRGDYNYITNRRGVQRYWEERLEEVRQYENFYTVGMRGIHDGAMEGVKTLQERTDALQRVIDDQRKMLAKYVTRSVCKVPQVFVPYKEVLQIMENGLNVPDDVTLMWCDDNYGYMTRLSDGLQRQRMGGAGVYYHLSYWGRPHDYMWLCTTQPGLVYNEMRQAYDSHARKLWIVNVHDVKTAAYDLELFLDMAWNIDVVSGNTIEGHLRQWLCRDYGERAGQVLLPAMREFYRLCGIRKPEFMGWNQVELDKVRHWRGWSQVANTEFSQTEFGNEMQRYLDDYAALRCSIDSAEGLVPEERRDAFFAQIKYPVCCSAAMSVKMLEAQRARMMYPGVCDESLYLREDSLLVACAKSIRAYKEIRRMTDYYNNVMSGGKWRHSMCMNPRDLFVFYPPSLPLWLDDGDVERYAGRADVAAAPVERLDDNTYVACNACDYAAASPGTHTVQMLGHSMNAVALPKGGRVTYGFDCRMAGEAVLRLAMIPTQPDDRGDIRFSVSVDGGEAVVCSLKEPYRSENWKRNVMRGQAIKTIRHTLSRGKHTLSVTALDNHVVFDQWMADFRPEREFYVFPVAGNGMKAGGARQCASIDMTTKIGCK